MRRLLPILASFALFVAAVAFTHAQIPLTGAGLGAPKSGGGAYSGPGDVVGSATFWWGLRGYNAAYSGNAVRLCLAADVTCADITIDTSTGGLKASDLSFLGCNNSTTICTVNRIYDQSGATNCSAAACNLIQGTEANRATFIAAGAANGCPSTALPCMSFAAGKFYSAASLGSVPQPFTHSIVAERTGNTSANGTIMCGGCGGIQSLFGAGANLVAIFSGSSVPTAAANDNTWHALQNIFNNASSIIYVDGSSNSVSTGTSTAAVGSVGLGNNGTGNDFVGKFAESGMWSIGFSGGQQSSMNSNQHSYWGF